MEGLGDIEHVLLVRLAGEFLEVVVECVLEIHVLACASVDSGMVFHHQLRDEAGQFELII